MSEKTLEVRAAKNVGTLYEICYKGGGQVPTSLNGYYTTRKAAQYALDNYVPPRPKRKVKKDEQTNG